MEELIKKSKFKKGISFEKEEFKKAFEFSLKKIDESLEFFKDGYPSPASINNVYPKIGNIEWTSSFYNGMLWLAYLYTKDDKYKYYSHLKLEDYEERLLKNINTNTHDLGFLYILSCKADYLITKDKKAKEVALLAAKLLMVRYNEVAKIIQAWGDLDDENEKGRIIIDCLMNVPLLFWASEETGDYSFREAAINHVNQTRKYIIRDDDTTFHTYYFDTVTGKAKYGVTNQGYSDQSCWARGQAWGIYGLSLAYKYTKDKNFLVDAKRLSNHFLNNLPSDYIAYWDLVFTDGDEERDSSSSAIAATGLLELIQYLDEDDEYREIYRNAAIMMTKSLIDNYTSVSDKKSNGILLHAVYGKPHNNGVDECNIWGDYFFMETLYKLLVEDPNFW
ncbi:MAG: glycoside hydrolase family 88 protein [Sphaerochaetaceae bacterium]|nr:glycoside hydrolase family 88 protein [Sphaerochaetaceae bacterium]